MNFEFALEQISQNLKILSEIENENLNNSEKIVSLKLKFVINKLRKFNFEIVKIMRKHELRVGDENIDK